VNIPKQIYIAIAAIIALITVIAITTLYNPRQENPVFTEEIGEEKTTTPNTPSKRSSGGSTSNQMNDITGDYTIEPSIYIYKEHEYPEIIVEIKITSGKNTVITVMSVTIDDLTPRSPIIREFNIHM